MNFAPPPTMGPPSFHARSIEWGGMADFNPLVRIPPTVHSTHTPSTPRIAFLSRPFSGVNRYLIWPANTGRACVRACGRTPAKPTDDDGMDYRVTTRRAGVFRIRCEHHHIVSCSRAEIKPFRGVGVMPGPASRLSQGLSVDTERWRYRTRDFRVFGHKF